LLAEELTLMPLEAESNDLRTGGASGSVASCVVSMETSMRPRNWSNKKMAAPTKQDNSIIVEPFMVTSQEEKKEIDLIFEPTVSLWLSFQRGF
jgi:hypothetical protein